MASRMDGEKRHTLRVDFQGAHVEVTLDGQRSLEWDDDTSEEAGPIRVWTKADSVTLFDDFPTRLDRGRIDAHHDPRRAADRAGHPTGILPGPTRDGPGNRVAPR